MPTCSPRSTRDIASRDGQSPGDVKGDEAGMMIRTADGHRAPPRYPDGQDFDICDQEMTAHMSRIRSFREDFG
jgi:hypothetical protein